MRFAVVGLCGLIGGGAGDLCEEAVACGELCGGAACGCELAFLCDELLDEGCFGSECAAGVGGAECDGDVVVELAGVEEWFLAEWCALVGECGGVGGDVEAEVGEEFEDADAWSGSWCVALECGEEVCAEGAVFGVL